MTVCCTGALLFHGGLFFAFLFFFYTCSIFFILVVKIQCLVFVLFSWAFRCVPTMHRNAYIEVALRKRVRDWCRQRYKKCDHSSIVYRITFEKMAICSGFSRVVRMVVRCGAE